MRRLAMTVCDLCDETKNCVRREIERKEYDICSGCWNPLAKKLKGKGRMKRERETEFLPPPTKDRELPEPKAAPGGRPKIWAGARGM